MRIGLLALALVTLPATGCAALGAGYPLGAHPTPTATSILPPTPTVLPTPPPVHRTPTPKPSPTPVISRSYAAFLGTICQAFATGDAGTIINALPYYQYNSGLRYGNFGDGEGQTGDPSLMRTWLAAHRARCVYFTPDVAGHGTVLTRGWRVNGMNWSLIEMDVYGNQWKINDFTFGRRAALWWAVQSSQPILAYRG